MLPLCSATPNYSFHSRIPTHGGHQPIFSSWKVFEIKCIVEDKITFGLSNDTHFQGVSFKTQATSSFFSNFTGNTEQSSFTGFINMPSSPSKLDDYECIFSNKWSYPVGSLSEPNSAGRGDLKFIESSGVFAVGDEFAGLTDQLPESNSNLSIGADPEIISTIDAVPDSPALGSDSLGMDGDSLSNLKTNVEDLYRAINESIGSSANKGENIVKSLLDVGNSSLTLAIKNATEAVDNAVNELLSTVDQAKEFAGNVLTSWSSNLKDATSNAGVIAVDVLRQTIVAVEYSLTNGATYVVYSYGFVKELLPPDIHNLFNLTEERAIEILRPAGTALQQVYVAIEGLERGLGLDPSDPIVPFILLVGTSATLWVFYWVSIHGGYSGDLSPLSTLELLSGKESVALIDVRSEDLRERDGIPDLRRAARFRYANVTPPQLDGPVQKLLKNGRELDDALLAVIIRNLKIVQDRSGVIVMDADGTRSRGIARSLRKLGVKKPYLVQGGFQSWVKQGLRIKELKPETALSILNEEAEAILEDISPTPLKLLGYGVGFIAAVYALLEWEITLQFIGIVGLGLTIYRRLSSYENSEDFKQDLRVLLAPARLGAQAFSWAAGKLETNGIGLPTSPSSADVQNRVLQAAAKHESQPSDIEEFKDPIPESAVPVNDNVDLSEA
ncbi:uncharacterized protein LOC131150497 [Malania oleifera]|uniref:uncharacterized protein LOC131150497 n=1 Tax=Malania oleifera TaxID=397392 RepID=UPI0025ADE341|nr:uncharacterized protein LOC131150497 [Malania oleifera]